MAEDKASQEQVEPQLSPQLAELRERVSAGIHQGEPFEITVTNGELEETIAWYLERQPDIPFRNPQVSIDPDGLEAQVEAHLGTLQLPLSGRANILLHEAVPLITIEQLEVAQTGLPDFVLLQIQDGLNRQLNMREEDLPLIIEGLELEEGRLTVRGNIR